MNKDLKQFYSKHSDRNVRMSDEAAKRVKENIFARLGSVTVDDAEPVSFWGKFGRIFAHGYMIAPLVVLLFIAGTAYASASALPGDALYGVKRTVENTRLALSPTAEAKVKLQEEFAQKRLEELEALRQSHLPEAVSHNNSDHDNNTNDNDSVEVNIDGDNVSANVSNNSIDNNGQEQSRQAKARNEARKAIQSLKESQQALEQKGENGKSQELNRKIQLFDRRLQDNSESSNNSHGGGSLKTQVESSANLNLGRN